MREIERNYIVVRPLAVVSWQPRFAHLKDGEVQHTLWENKDRTFYVSVGTDKPTKARESYPLFRAKVKPRAGVFIARFPDLHGKAHELEHSDKDSLAWRSFAAFLGFRPKDRGKVAKESARRIAAAGDVLPWTRALVWALEQADGELEPLHTLWRKPGGHYWLASGTKRPDRDQAAREAFRVEPARGLWRTQVVAGGMAHTLASSDLGQVTADALGIMLSGRPLVWESGRGRIDKDCVAV